MHEVSESPPLFLNARQLAEQLGLSTGQVRSLAKSGRIPEIIIGKNTRRYNLDAVVSALTNHQSQRTQKGK